MPERMHQRFDDSPPPAKKIKTVSETLPPRVLKKPSAPGSLTQATKAAIASNSHEIRSGKPLYQKTQAPRGTSSLKEKASALLNFRRELPIWAHTEDIRQSLRSKDVLLLVGETGSGKSTQVPQFLIDEAWCKIQSVEITENEITETVKVGGCIAITEPRRVAAITLARRVAEEMGTPLGSSSPASKVGYSVRFDNSTSPSTRIKFLTEGMLLQEMLRDPWLRQYSAVIVDEVHERGVNVDLVMGFLRNMVAGRNEGRGGLPLKVAVMSATADLEGLQRFFEDGYGSQQGPVVKEPNEELVEPAGLSAGEGANSESEWSGIVSDNEEGVSGKRKTHAMNNGAQRLPQLEEHTADATKPTNSATSNSQHVSVCHISGRQYPVQTIYSPTPVPDFLDASLRTIFRIHYAEPLPGDILVFLTGQETVESLSSLVNEFALTLPPSVPKLLVLPLFAALPQAAQQLVFAPPPPKTRKVILATNIAETSVTVAGVRFVVDCGKSKIKHFRARLGLDSLLVKPISQSAATQRKGRAGREAPGKCYRLYTEQAYLALAPSPTPEILRCDLSQALLTIKARGVADILAFPFLSPPPREALERALLQLLQLGALDACGRISALGLQMARLPLTAPLGRVLLAAAEPAMDCVAQVIDIIACLSVENIFLNVESEETREAAEGARRALFRREGDHLTLLATVQAYVAETADRKAWAERHFVSHRAMQAVMDVRKQLLAQRHHLALPSSPPPLPATSTSNPQTPLPPSPTLATSILKSFLTGFATNTARLVPDGSYRTLVGHQSVAIHPSSGLFGKKVEAIMYNEFVFTNRSYARGVSAVQMDWVGEVVGG